MNIGAVIIGDEILSGKRQDRHFAYLQSSLAKRGLELSWTVIVGDDAKQLERFLRFSMAENELVFSFGGIGATPDDRTRQTVATVTGVALTPHPDALKEIEAQFGDMAYPNRVLMGYLPEGSRIIPNTINRVPGFSVKHHHFMPGFPEMSWPMVEWLLDEQYPHLRDLKPTYEEIIYVFKGRESDLLDTMEKVMKLYPAVLLSSLPSLTTEGHIEFSLRGEKADVEQSMALMIKAIEKAGFDWSTQLSGKP